MNNYERIKSMSIDEMAEYIDNYVNCGSCPAFLFCSKEFTCKKFIEQWLQKEYER